MGGRRPSDISEIAGKSKKITKQTKELHKKIKEKNVQATLNIAFNIATSETGIENFALGMTILKALYRKLKDIENKKVHLNSEEREKIASKVLSKIEKEKNLTISSGIRELIIRSAKKSLKGEAKWKKK